jgi:hypothetical protein
MLSRSRIYSPNWRLDPPFVKWRGTPNRREQTSVARPPAPRIGHTRAVWNGHETACPENHPNRESIPSIVSVCRRANSVREQTDSNEYESAFRSGRIGKRSEKGRYCCAEEVPVPGMLAG